MAKSRKVLGPKVLVLRTSDAGGVSSNGFVWPKKGLVTCPDWNPRAECGNGLHGLRVTDQNPGVWRNAVDSVWQVLEVYANEIVDLGGKVKFPRGWVVFSGSASEAGEYLHVRAPGSWYGAKVTGGDYAKVTGGDYAKVTGGYGAKVTGGDYAKVTGGDCTKVTGGHGAKVTGGDCALLRWDLITSMVIVRVGENGIEPNVAYKCVDGKAVKA
jgi:hypothetical protein